MESMNAKPKLRWLLAAAALFVVGAAGVVKLRPANRGQTLVPTAEVRRMNLEVKVYARGELRASHSAMLLAPPVGGMLVIERLAPSGTLAKAGDIVIEFDPTEQKHYLDQSRYDLEEATQSIAKARADAVVQAAKDQVDLLKAHFDVRRAQLDVSKNELVSAIDAKKNLLALDEAKRALAELEQDVKARARSNQAAIEVARDQEAKARLGMQRAERNLDEMRVRSPLEGIISIRPNSEAYGGMIFEGMELPDFRVGDQVGAGSSVAEAMDVNHMELQASIDEVDRAAIRPNLPIRVQVDGLPGVVFPGVVKTVAGVAVQNWWAPPGMQKFDATFELNRPDSRLRPGMTAEVTVLGDQAPNALVIPRQAVFENAGKPRVYVREGSRFVARLVKVSLSTETYLAVEGLKPGERVALVDPTKSSALNPVPIPPFVPKPIEEMK